MLNVLKPAKEFADRFTVIYEPMLASIASLKLKNQNLRRTRDLLLPKLISGAIDVSASRAGGRLS
jgi:type I restriction enzyme S subunit